MSFFESLESRSLMSGSPAHTVLPTFESSAAATFVAAAAKALPKVLGTWVGKLSIPGVHTQPVKIVFSKQTSKGVLTGLLTTSADSSIKVAVTGTVKSNGSLSISLKGGHSGGAINGSGSGPLKSSNKKVTLAIKFTQGGSVFPGTITLAKA